MLKFISTDLTLDASAIEGVQSRTVSGVAVPYGVAATVSDGTKVIFSEGSLPVDGKAPKLYLNHDSEQAIGIVTERVDTPQGMMFSARLSKTARAEEALQLSLDTVIDSVSVGVNPTKFKMQKDGTMLVEAADWVELSLVTGRPAFAGAVITDVAATEPESIHQDDTELDNIPTEVSTQEKEPMNEAAPIEASAIIPTSPVVFAEPKREFKMPTAGEYLAAYHIGGDTFAKVNAAFYDVARRNQSAIEAVSQDLTSDVPGLLPLPVVGNLFQNYNFVRPVVSAFGTRAMPNGQGISFIRPTITTPTAAGVQSTQGTAVASQTMVLAANTVSRQTVAGSIGSAENMSATTNLFPTHLVVSVDVWRKLGAQVDDVNRPVFPAIGAPGLIGQNTLGAGSAASWSGMNPLGLEIVVDGNLASGTMLVVHAPAVEFYEAQQGMRSVENPEILARTFSYYGYFSTFVNDAQNPSAVAGSQFIQAITVA